MALTYRNVLKNHVVVVPEPADIIAAAEAEAERLLRKGTKRDRLDAELLTDRAKARAAAQRQTLAKMDQSRRWERHVAPPSVTPVRESTVAAHADAPVKAAKAASKPAVEA